MGTKESAKKATQTLLERDPDYFKRLGALGGRKSRGGGFAYDGRTKLQKLLRRPTVGQKKAKTAGAKGGSISRRVAHA